MENANSLHAPCSLILLIGLPGSGKSTLARSLLTVDPQAKLISTDSIRAQLFGNEANQGSWLKVWLEVRQQFQDAVSQIQQGQASIAIYDATNAVRKQRRDAIALSRKSGFDRIIALWVNTPISTCLERNQRRDRQVPEEIILRMHRRLQSASPSLTEDLNGLIELNS